MVQRWVIKKVHHKFIIVIYNFSAKILLQILNMQKQENIQV